jgi:hypothetical protein
LKSPFKESADQRRIRMTILGIFIGALIAVLVGVILYVLNRENRFE